MLLVGPPCATPRAAARTRPARRRSFSIAFTAPPSRQCGCASSAWPGRPSTVTTGVSEPRHARPHLEPGRLRADAGVGAHAVLHARRCPPAPDDSSSVFVHTTTVAGEPDAEPRERLGREHHAADAALHVARAAAVEVAVADLGAHGSLVQRSTGSGGDDVDVPVQQQRAAAAGAGERSRRAAAGPANSSPGSTWREPATSARRGSQMSTAAPAPRAGRRGSAAGRPPRGPGRRWSAPWCRTRPGRRQLDELVAAGGNLVEDALLQRHCRR